MPKIGMSDPNTKANILFGIVIVLVVFIGASFWRVNSSRVPVDGKTNCPEVGPSGAVSFLIDRTDALSPTQKMSIENDLGLSEKTQIRRVGLISQIPKHYEVSVFKVEEAALNIPEGELGICNPGNESPSTLKQLYSNPRMMQARWKSMFLNKLSSSLETTLSGQPDKISPILESIQTVSLRFLGRPDLRSKPRKLVIVSDLLQNSGVLSQITSSPTFSEFQSRPDYVHLRTDLTAVDVVIFYVRRRQYSGLQGAKHISFWESYFLDNGVSSDNLSVKSVEG